MKTSIVRDKTRFLVRILAKPFVFFGVSPNFISFFSLVMAAGVFYAVYERWFIAAAVLIALNGLADVVDGETARSTNKASAFGKFFDRTIDKISDILMLAPFIIFGYVDVALGIYVLAGMLLATTISANIESVLKSNVSNAFSLRFVRIILTIGFIIWGEFEYLFYVLAALVTYSLIHRSYAAYSIYRKGPVE